MTRYHARASPSSDPLARHLDTLASSFDLIGERLREAIADAVGRTVADGVGEAVLAALSGPDAASHRHRSSSCSWSGRSSGWDEPERLSWARDDHDHGERFDVSRYDDADPYDEDPAYDTSAEPGAEPKPMPWAVAVTAGLQAAAWNLSRNPGQKSVSGSVGVGLLAFLLTWLGGQSAVVVAGLAASALGLLSLPDLCNYGIAFLRQAVTP